MVLVVGIVDGTVGAVVDLVVVVVLVSEVVIAGLGVIDLGLVLGPDLVNGKV